jgi:hypothetical protein
MPFNTEAKIEIRNDSSTLIRNLFFQIGYYEENARTEVEPTFHAQYRRTNPTSSESVPLLEARGKGWLAGVKLDIQNREWWLKPPLREIFLPRGFGLGLLEGWETIVVDGAEPIVGTGAEDYFSGGLLLQRRALLHADTRMHEAKLLDGPGVRLPSASG